MCQRVGHAAAWAAAVRPCENLPSLFLVLLLLTSSSLKSDRGCICPDLMHQAACPVLHLHVALAHIYMVTVVQ